MSQEHLDKLARVNQEFYICESCDVGFDVDELCEHDDHTLCQDCCETINEQEYKEQFGPLEKEDLD